MDKATVQIPTFVLTEEGKVLQDAPEAFTSMTDGIESAFEKIDTQDEPNVTYVVYRRKG